MKKLEVRELKIDELGKLGVSAVAFVDKPAIEIDFKTFDKNKRYEFNDEQRIVTGVAMIPEQLIYRFDESGEYYVKFSKETIKQIAINFFKTNSNSNVNKMHDTGNNVDGVYLFESFVVDSARGIQGLKGQEHADGTWILSYKVDNKEVWDAIKGGEFKGFSVEGMFEEHVELKSDTFKTQIYNSMRNAIEKFIEKVLLQETPIPAVTEETEKKFADVVLKDGTTIQADTEALEVGSNVTVMVADAAEPLPDGTYETGEGIEFVVVGGAVTELIHESKDDEAKEDATATLMREIAELKETLNASSEKFEKEISDLKKLTLSAIERSEKFEANTVECLVELSKGDLPTEAITFKTDEKTERLNKVASAFAKLK